jgi:dGTPase
VSGAEEYLGPKAGLRRHAEKPPENRTEAQRDRDRILYTSAFQRLAGITQIAAAEAGQVIHNRLTHSLKVAQVARRLAQRLGRDADSQETVAAAALGHDLGHPPFGHVAEKELDDLAADWGGFEGNAQSFRIVNTLALRDAAYRGLNLTAPTLNGMLKYPWLRDPSDRKKSEKWGAYEHERLAFDFTRTGFATDQRSVEAELMDWADDVTYAVHDLEDFHRLGLIPLERLVRGDERERFFASFFADKGGERVLRDKFASFDEADLDAAMDFVFTQALGDVTPYRGAREERIYIRSRTSYLIGWFINAVTLAGDEVKIDPRRRAEVAVLKELAWFYVITDPSLATLQHGQRRVIRDLHNIYYEAVDQPERWQLFPLAQQELLRITRGDERRYRIATDFVAGLTEDLAYELHQRLTGVSRGSILDAAARASR